MGGGGDCTHTVNNQETPNRHGVGGHMIGSIATKKTGVDMIAKIAVILEGGGFHLDQCLAFGL